MLDAIPWEDKGSKKTYNVLIFFRVVSHLWHCDGPADIFAILCLAWRAVSLLPLMLSVVGHTCVLHLQLDVEDCDDLSLPLADVYIAVQAQYL